jgi:hypothetical protein
MNTEHLLPSTRITAARIAARATEERLRRMGCRAASTADPGRESDPDRQP